MSLIIKGVEMPKDKRIEILVFPNGYVAVYDSDGYLQDGRAVPLPEGHGRLGDLDALMKKLLTKEDGRHINDRDSDGWPNMLYVETVRTTIEDAHAIVPAEGGEH